MSDGEAGQRNVGKMNKSSGAASKQVWSSQTTSDRAHEAVVFNYLKRFTTIWFHFNKVRMPPVSNSWCRASSRYNVILQFRCGDS